MASIPFKPLQPTQFQFQLQLYSSTILLNPFKFHTLPRISSSIHVTHVETPEQEISGTRRDSKTNSNENGSGFSSFTPKYKRVDSGQENGAKRVVLKDRNAKLKPNRRTSESSSSTNNKKAKSESKKSKIDSTLRIGLDMCSKRGDVLSAIRLYDLALLQGIVMGQYHYAVLLYLCASAATGLIHPAKSGSGNRTLNAPNEPSSHNNSKEFNVIDHDSHLLSSSTVDEFVQFMKNSAKKSNLQSVRHEDTGIKVSEDVRHYALTRGFEIYEKMISDKVQMNEATLTSVARMAMALGNGDMAFHVVKQMKEDGINPKLRSYGPALSVFCNNGDVDKAFIVEQHMLENGIYPEELELEALLKVSIEAGRSEKVYYLLHKLREGVRQVSPSTADLIDKWFNSKVASRVGKRKWDVRSIHKAIKNGGGGWHGQGWLGNGKWTVSHTIVGSDGCCKCCAEKLVTIDLDPEETEKFAKSVASIAAQREKNSSFQKFQRWLDYYGPFEAVIDGANVGLYSQRKFRPSKVNAVVNGIRQMLPSKKWPLIVLHNRRITGDKMDEPFNRSLVEKWKNADAIYATPTGSNDDWYWLYAAIKFRCLLVTNDEMRDHLFQLLGNDFFPKWKERHQVRFSFSETGPVFHMPPPCSIVIQESEEGYWHVPIASELESEVERTWLCIRRGNSPMANQDSSTVNISKNVGDPTHKCPPTSSDPPHNQGDARSSTRRKNQVKVTGKTHGSHGRELNAAEELGSCVVDFQI
ncbi:hypothetical protein R3W88_019339 [Solanum pinnatisectum]|uniref:ribonuclease P n=1 Tax=Solanum pinnatisectum TaxID=50273 RepID=A0AAV9KK17_9SOLN|nr:hypothetical protein R3W88_019339 [Solanum pinnatisectum]